MWIFLANWVAFATPYFRTNDRDPIAPRAAPIVATRWLGLGIEPIRNDPSDNRHRASVNLWWFGLAAFGAGALALAPVLWLTFDQRQKANRALTERTRSLVRAQEELTLTAKLTAVGAVTSHLIHGLRNPLSGLQHFMANHAPGPGAEHEMEWRLAASATRRMQNMVNDIIRVLREDSGAANHEISLQDLAKMTWRKMSPFAGLSRVHLEMKLLAPECLAISHRDANLVLLILETLIQNAIQATPSDQPVLVEIASSGAHVLFKVQDGGRGLPQSIAETVFTPRASTKEMGSGIGLAISRQLALALGAELSVQSSTPQGCVFILNLPSRLISGRSSNQPAAPLRHDPNGRPAPPAGPASSRPA